MNLQKQCRSCRAYFPGELESLKEYCDKKGCKERGKWQIQSIKHKRNVTMDTFDIYDLDRPRTTHKGSILDYERVCRKCGGPLKRKDGSYSWSARYCVEHRGYGYTLFARYNWGEISYNYKESIKEKHKKLINELADKLEIPKELRKNVIICESCKCLCKTVSNTYWSWRVGQDKDKMKVCKLGLINAHHIIPVHTLTKDNLGLMWDKDNLICLCPTCHNKTMKKTKKINDFKKYYTLDHYIKKGS